MPAPDEVRSGVELTATDSTLAVPPVERKLLTFWSDSVPSGSWSRMARTWFEVVRMRSSVFALKVVVWSPAAMPSASESWPSTV